MPSLFHNRLSWVGAAVAAFGAAGIFFFAVFDQVAARSNPYWGMFAWVIFPAIMIFGGAVVALGIARERARRRTAAPNSISALPVWDFNLAGPRRWFLAAALFVGIFVPLSAVGGYHAYEVSESVSFCGAACHTSMSPEHRAFAESPHAAVKCVDCHVGPGASGYVQAKTLGVHRLWAAMTDSFKRPIPSPLQSLPHSSGTCLSCHSSARFAGQKLKTFAHYAYDEANTPRQVDLVLNVGGRSSDGRSEGIHAHQAKRIEFAYLDESFQVIPWVKVTALDGKVTEYRIEDSKITHDQADGAPRRSMDCVDCHNRAGHSFETPDYAVNMSMLHGRLDSSLPFLKKQAIDVLGRSYPTSREGEATIAREVEAFYAKTYPEVKAKQAPQIVAAVAELQRIYRNNVFPEMKASWETFPNNIGHFYSPGCYRCHGGNMKSVDGRVIPKDCQTCHSVSGQVEGKAAARMIGKEFVHPLDMGDLKDATCTDCHSGRGLPQ